MGYIVVAPIGDKPEAIFVGMKQFATERAILITPTSKMKESQKLKDKLELFTVKTEIIELKGNVLEEMFKIFGNLASIYDNEQLIINVATGDQMSTCSALSAAYANGLKSFGVMNGECMLFPIMKLSYYNELSENKMIMLKELSDKKYVSLKELSNKLGMSRSLLSYHVNGNYKYKGLKEFRLVDVKEKNNNLLIKLSEMGNLLLKGYIKQKSGGE